jgi:hypothetical protein
MFTVASPSRVPEELFRIEEFSGPDSIIKAEEDESEENEKAGDATDARIIAATSAAEEKVRSM